MLFYNFLYHAESLGRRMLPRLKRWNSLKHYTVCGAVVTCLLQRKGPSKARAKALGRRRALEDEGLWKTAMAHRMQTLLERKGGLEGKGASKEEAKALRRQSVNRTVRVYSFSTQTSKHPTLLTITRNLLRLV